MRPVDAGYCRFESALDGTLSLYWFARMNEALDARAENERRMEKWYKDNGNKR